MTDYEIYVSLLCLITYAMFTILSVVIVWTIMSLSIKLIRSGAEDRQIIREYSRSFEFRGFNNLIKKVIYIASLIVFVAFAIAFVFSLTVQNSKDINIDFASGYRVVQTGSMAKKHEKNTYLFENGLNDQIQTFDLIKTEQLPGEMELQLYDIVVYEVEDMLIVHRIVGIEEPNDYHPDCRYFKLQGDASESADRYPVRYDQMRAIYKGERIPFVGSFVMFLQSPVGWLCILLALVAMIATPILEHKLEKEREERYDEYLDRVLYLGDRRRY